MAKYVLITSLQVINESLRLANVVPGVFRRALRDIKFKGYKYVI